MYREMLGRVAFLLDFLIELEMNNGPLRQEVPSKQLPSVHVLYELEVRVSPHRDSLNLV